MTIAPQEGRKKEQNALTESQQEEMAYKYAFLPTPPDGGWGWVVVFSSFMIHVLADGFTYTFGIFYVSILNYFGASKSAASWIASILVGVTLGSGPISGTLVNKFGCRFVTILGAILASFSLFLSVFAKSVAVLYVTIGVGTGLGFGLIYLPAIISVTGYFEKKRSFATGIAVCGSGIGTFAFSPFVEFLIETYSWKGALLILSSVMMNCVVFGALFRPLEMGTLSALDEEACRQKNGSALPEKQLMLKEHYEFDDVPTIEWKGSPRDSFEQDEEDLLYYAQISPPNNHSNNFPRTNSQIYFNNRLSQLKEESDVLQMSTSQPTILHQPDSPLVKSFGGHRSLDSRKLSSLPNVHYSLHGSGLLYRRDIFYRGSLSNVQEYKSNPQSYRSSIIRIPDTEETPSEKERMKVCGCVPCSKETRETLLSLTGWSLMFDRIFLLFVLSNFCTSIGFNAPYIFIVDRALELGIDSDKASYLLSIIGISNTLSRVILGYFSDKPWVNRLYLYNISLTLCGIGTIFSIWFTNFASQAFYAAVFGVTSGAYVGLTSVVLVDLLGMEKLTNAFGLLLMFQGIASLIGPPMCGALYDMSQSYDYSFLLAGGMIAISGIMLFFIPCVQRIQEKKDLKSKKFST